jgi:hypothetical protein
MRGFGSVLMALAIAGSAVLIGPVDEASALTDCVFTPGPATLTLTVNCQTDTTILIPNGFTLDGNGKTITAVDPVGGHFRGAVVKNAGVEAHVKNLGVTASGLANVCDGGDDRLRGILFEGAAGTIVNNTVTNINQGASGCQEGNAIDVRNEPFDTSGSDLLVTITGNVATNYQKTGIVANGSVAATIKNNSVTGAGPVNYIAQNGIQIGFGGTAVVEDNTVGGNDYTPKSFVSCGLLFFDADGVRANGNKMSNNERNLCNFGRGGGDAHPNP